MDKMTEVILNVVASIISMVALICSIWVLQNAQQRYSATKARIAKDDDEYLRSLKESLSDN